MSSGAAAHGAAGARPTSRSKKKSGEAEEPENHERWLLTYADMITLLMALFMVLFSMSAVNTSKYKYLQKSLKEAFSGHILAGGASILQSGAAQTRTRSLTPTMLGAQSQMSSMSQSALQHEYKAATAEQDDLQGLARQLNAYASSHGFANEVNATVERRGLVVTVLTDKLLFTSGQATLQQPGMPLLNEVAQLLNLDADHHPIVVEGYTDNQPIATAQFPSNWELSTARATNVVRYLIGRQIPEYRLSAAGYADQFPVASNATPTGRADNRRVEIVLQRINPMPSTTSQP